VRQTPGSLLDLRVVVLKLSKRHYSVTLETVHALVRHEAAAEDKILAQSKQWAKREIFRSLYEPCRNKEGTYGAPKAIQNRT
jgi:hypothetical protein